MSSSAFACPKSVLATALLCALSLSAQAAETLRLRIGVEGAYPPFSSVGPDGQLRGFDIDIAKAVCTQMAAQCTQVQQDFDGIIPALQARKFDLIVASLSITPERLKVVDFSDKYYKTPNRLISKTSQPIDGTPSSFQGKKIGVQRSTINDRFATDKFTGATIVRYAKQDDVYLDLVAGRIDATLVDAVAGESGFLKTPAGKDFALTGPAYIDPSYFGLGVGIAMRRGDDALRLKVNAAIKSIRASGEYQKIQDKYFSFDVYGQ